MSISSELIIGRRSGVEQVYEIDRAKGIRAETCKILVIDDDPGLQRLIQRTLESGAQVLQEFDGDFDLDLSDVDMVVLDYQLPGADGLTILEGMTGDYPDLPILFMTGFGDMEVAKKALQLGAKEYMPKPFQPDDLRRVVSRWVKGFQAKPDPQHDSYISQGVDGITRDLVNLLTAFNKAGSEITARVIRYNSRSVVVETSPDVDWELGDALSHTCVTLGNRSMEVAGAFVSKVTTLSDRVLIEIGLPGIWKIEGYEEGVQPEEISRLIRDKGVSKVPTYDRFGAGAAEREKIPLHYRATVADLVSILQEVHDDLEVLQNSFHESGVEDRVQFEANLVEYARDRFFPIFSEAIGRFELAAESAGNEGLKEDFKRFSQRSLYPLILCSPFMCRAIGKPVGVPGDFGMLGLMLGNPFEGHSLFARILNAWAADEQYASGAYRHRIHLLTTAIEDVAEGNEKKNQKTKVLSMASGVAYEVQRFISSCSDSVQVDFELVDFSSVTLDEAKSQFSDCSRFADPKGVNVNFCQSSVIELANQTRGAKGGAELSVDDQYHLVYCTGLFDYLSDLLCRRVIDYLYTLVQPGGRLIVSNFTHHSPVKNFMDFVLDWPLIYRSKEHFEELVTKTAAKGCFDIETSDSGIEVYSIIRKPE